VEVRGIFHELRSRATQNFDGQFKSIFGGNPSGAHKGLTNSARFALGVVLIYQTGLAVPA
jgi:hypothetical protein